MAAARRTFPDDPKGENEDKLIDSINRWCAQEKNNNAHKDRIAALNQLIIMIRMAHDKNDAMAKVAKKEGKEEKKSHKADKKDTLDHVIKTWESAMVPSEDKSSFQPASAFMTKTLGLSDADSKSANGITLIISSLKESAPAGSEDDWFKVDIEDEKRTPSPVSQAGSESADVYWLRGQINALQQAIDREKKSHLDECKSLNEQITVITRNPGISKDEAFRSGVELLQKRLMEIARKEATPSLFNKKSPRDQFVTRLNSAPAKYTYYRGIVTILNEVHTKHPHLSDNLPINDRSPHITRIHPVSPAQRPAAGAAAAAASQRPQKT